VENHTKTIEIAGIYMTSSIICQTSKGKKGNSNSVIVNKGNLSQSISLKE